MQDKKFTYLISPICCIFSSFSSFLGSSAAFFLALGFPGGLAGSFFFEFLAIGIVTVTDVYVEQFVRCSSCKKKVRQNLLYLLIKNYIRDK